MSVLAICSWLLRTTDHSGRLVGLGGGVSWGTFAGLLCTICSYGALPALPASLKLGKGCTGRSYKIVRV